MSDVSTPRDASARVSWFSTGKLLVFALVLLIGSTTLIFVRQIQIVDAQDELLKSLTKAKLEDQKLREEIRQLRRGQSVVGSIPTYGALVAALATAVGLVTAALRSVGERKESREQREREMANELRHREAEQHEREAASLARFDEGMKDVIGNLASDNPLQQAGAAASLMTSIQTLLKPEFSGTFQDAVFFFVVATTKTGASYSEEVRRLLVRAFERAARLRVPSISDDARPFLLDLSRSRLDRIDLSGMDLREADIAFAHLKDANLTRTNLSRAKGYGVDLEGANLWHADLNEARLRGAKCVRTRFNEANLVAARLEESDLMLSEFFRAELQSAHLDGARLNGTRFEGADVNDAFFRDLQEFDEKAKASMILALNWRKAHFDPPVMRELEQLSALRG